MKISDNDKKMLVNGIYEDLEFIAKTHNYNIDYPLLYIGICKNITMIEKDNFNHEDLYNYVLFPISEEINISLMGDVTTNILVEAKIRGEVVDNIEKILSKYCEIKTISQRIEDQYNN